MKKTLSHLDKKTSSPPYSARWYQAMTLTERVPCVRTLADSGSQMDGERAAQRFAQWKNSLPFRQSDQRFAQRLGADAVSEGDLRILLGQSSEALQAACSTPPAWLKELISAFTDQDEVPLVHLPVEQLEDVQTRAVFLTIRPLVERSFARFHKGLQMLQQKHSRLPFHPQTIDFLLFPHILKRLLSRMTRTLVLELNVARVQGELQGETPAQRFDYFLQRLAQPEQALTFFEEYPVLARHLVETLERWLACELEFFQRLCADWDEICQIFSPAEDPGMLIELHEGEGDTHEGGRSVTSLTWSSGLRLIYKPRSLAIDAHFQELLNWLNTQGCQPAFRTFKLLPRKNYGWCEFLVAQDCVSTAEVERFHQRLGGYLAILYALEATDFHAQNLIAVGENPMFVDLEALFHPRIDRHSGPLDPGYETIRHSVLRVGLLPQRVWANEHTEGIDLSPLAGQAGQTIPFPVATWKETGTDQMHIAREAMAIQFSGHRPQLQGQEIDALQYDKSVIEGFATVYRLLLQQREALPQLLHSLFAGDEVRVLLRSTQNYVMLQTDSFHPNVLRDALERDRLLDRLWIDIAYEPAFGKIIAAERADLLNEDIPKFTTRPSSRDLFTSQGETIADFFLETSLDMVSKGIHNLDEQDLERQIWVIQASFVGLALSSRTAPATRIPLRPARAPLTYTRLLQEASAIGNRVRRLAIAREKTVGWLSVTLVNGRDWRPVPTGLDLYNGLPGIAFFLAYLGQITRDQHYTALARLTLQTIQTQISGEQPLARRGSIGAFDGAGSLIYLFSHLGALWQEPELYREAEEIIARLPEFIAQDEFFDILNGAAGCIAALLSLYKVAPSEQTLATAIQCGDRLLSQASTLAQGIGWKNQHTPVPLAGMSHGNAGIALNLFRLFRVSGETRFRAAALAALEYERQLFSPEKQNWPDLREESADKQREGAEQTYMTAWCHGASGLGLARLGSLPYQDDPAIRAEIAAAVRTTLESGFGTNHSLCHGDIGNLDFLLSAIQKLPDLYSRQKLELIQTSLLESMEGQNWVSGVPMGIEAPGLMLGLAGTGYALLRQAEPERVPSILLLEPPEPAQW